MTTRLDVRSTTAEQWRTFYTSLDNCTVPQNGNSMFNAFLQGLMNIDRNNIPKNSQALRAQAAKKLREYRSEYDLTEAQIQEVETSKKQISIGFTIVLTILAELYNVRVMIFQAHWNKSINNYEVTNVMDINNTAPEYMVLLNKDKPPTESHFDMMISSTGRKPCYSFESDNETSFPIDTPPLVKYKDQVPTLDTVTDEVAQYTGKDFLWLNRTDDAVDVERYRRYYTSATLCHVAAQGDCLFSAIQGGLKLSDKYGKHVPTVEGMRNSVATYIQSRMGQLLTDELLLQLPFVSQQGQWVQEIFELVIPALVGLYDIRIIRYVVQTFYNSDKSGVDTYVTHVQDVGSPKAPFVTLLHHLGNHYDLLLLPETNKTNKACESCRIELGYGNQSFILSTSTPEDKPQLVPKGYIIPEEQKQEQKEEQKEEMKEEEEVEIIEDELSDVQMMDSDVEVIEPLEEKSNIHPRLKDINIHIDVKRHLTEICQPTDVDDYIYKYHDKNHCDSDRADKLKRMIDMIISKCSQIKKITCKTPPEDFQVQIYLQDPVANLSFDGQMTITCYLFHLLDLWKNQTYCKELDNCAYECGNGIKDSLANLQVLAMPDEPWGSGVFSVTLASKVLTTDSGQLFPNFLVFKYSNLDPVLIYHELFVGLMINKLKSLIPNFVFTYTFIYCVPPISPPNTFKLDLMCKPRNNIRNQPIPIQPMILLENTWNLDPFKHFLPHFMTSSKIDKQHKNKELMCILMQIYFADNMAVNMLNIAHNDLHSDNIMIQTLKQPIKLTYYVKYRNSEGKDISYKVSFESQFIVRIIDLGMATIKVKDETFGFQWKKEGIVKLENYCPAHKSLWGQMNEKQEEKLIYQLHHYIGYDDSKIEDWKLLTHPGYYSPGGIAEEKLFLYALLSLRKYIADELKFNFSSNTMVALIVKLLLFSIKWESMPEFVDLDPIQDSQYNTVKESVNPSK